MIFNIQEVQLAYKLLVIFLYSWFITYWSIPYVRKKLIKFNFVVEDKYKPGKAKIPTMGGIAILIGTLVSLALSQILLDRSQLGDLFIFYFIVIVYALYGILDDLFSFKNRYDKIFALLVLTFPIASLIQDTQINFFGGYIDFGVIYLLVIAPVYIMVISNMINIHAGYNGLTQGLSLIILITIGIKSFMVNGTDFLIYLIPVFGGVVAFFPEVFFPAKSLPGNSGDLLVGAAIGSFIIVNEFLWFGIFIFIPHIINFLMDTWTIAIKKIPDKKFGSIRADGTIKAPPTMKYKSLKFLIVSWFRLTEKQATLILYAFTGIFCILGLLIF